MHNVMKAAVLALGLASLAAPAFAASPIGASPIGTWETSTGESRYKVVACGDNGEICAKLIWLRKDAQTPDNLAYLNTWVVNGARPVDGNSWKGTVRFEGQTVGGQVTLVSGNAMQLKGCKLAFCKSVEFRRI